MSGLSALRPRHRRLILCGAGLALAAGYLCIPLPRFKSDYSTVVEDRKGRLLRAFLSESGQWHFPPQEAYQPPARLVKCVLMYEDRRFPFHPGVDASALIRAAWSNLRHRKVVSGASTLTMQTVRLAGRRPRTLPNKLLESLQALKLELHWSKARILRAYLNHAPYGGNVVGVRAASRRYFGKPPRHLTWSEAATLAVLPNSPGLISPVLNPVQLRRKRDSLLRKLEDSGILSADTARLARAEPLPRGTHSFQPAAPHWARRFHLDPATRGRLVRTTLDLDVQRTLANNLSAHAKTLARLGIRHAAAVILDTGTGEVRGYAGSPDFFDLAGHGQVDGADAPRSTGSILKPFLYALAMDAGQVLPRTWLRDVPTFYGAFSPSNADRTYSGLVTARDALIRSLNVPAVRLLNLFGTDRFYRFLKSAGLRTLFRTPDEYGLTLILGGGEARLLELAALYRSLGAGGGFSPPRMRLDAPPEPAPPLLISPESCFLVLEIMRKLKRPGAEYYWEQFSSSRPVAWKTGTSYGQRDAWALGLTPTWTIGVWAGNFNGESNPHLSGAGSAAPLMFQLFNSLPSNPAQSWFSRKGLSFRREVLCRDSGFRAGPDCPHTVTVDAPSRARPLPLCPYHRTLFVTPDGKWQVCSRCWTPGKVKRLTALVLPPEVTQFMRSSGIPQTPVPPHLPSCPAAPSDRPLRIIYPDPRARVMIPRDFQGEWQRVTVAAAHRDPRARVFWYVDGDYRGETRRVHKQPLLLGPGWHRIVLIDNAGNRAVRRFFVIRSSNADAG